MNEDQGKPEQPSSHDAFLTRGDSRDLLLRPKLPSSSQAGFAIGPILYMLALIGVGAGVLFSSYSQILRSNIQITNDVTAKNDLSGAMTTLAATSVIAATGTSNIFCPPGGTNMSSACSSSPANASVKMVELYPSNEVGADTKLPSAGTGPALTSGSFAGTAVEVGVYKLGSGVKLLDPWGHYYIFCRWESSVTSASPAITLLTAGADGTMQSTCANTIPTAHSDDQVIALNASEAVQRASVWQSSGTNATFGPGGQQVQVANNGTLTAVNLLVSGTATFGSLSLSSPLPIASGGTAATTITSARYNLGSGAVGDVLFQASSTPGARITLGSGAVGDAVFVAATGTAAREAMGATSVGELVFTATDAAAARAALGSGTIGDQLFTTSSAYSARLILGSGTIGNLVFTATNTSDAQGYLGATTVGEYLFSSSTYNSANAAYARQVLLGDGGTSAVGDQLFLASTVPAALSILGLTGSTTTTIASNTTGSAGSVPASGITGIVSIGQGGTGASSWATALSNLGGDNASNIISGTLNAARLATSGVSAGAYNWGTVDAYGRVTFAQNTVTSSITDGYGGQITATGTSGGDQLTFMTGSTINMTLDTNGNLGIGTQTPGQKLQVNGGNIRISNTATSSRELQFSTGTNSERWAVTTTGTPAESGSNAGSNFAIKSYDDSGTLLDTPFAINRATSAATFSGSVAAGGGFMGVFTGTFSGVFSGTSSGFSVNLGTSTASTSPHVTGDVTTGLFSATASSVSIATAGVEALRVTATQSVGIGTSSPASALDVGGIVSVRGTSAVAITSSDPSSIAIGATTYTASGCSWCWNVAVGKNTLSSLTSGNGETAIGGDALKYVTTGANNSGLSNGTLHNVTTGSNNTAIGFQVGYNTLTTGSGNILVGTSGSVDTPTSSTSNFLDIGNLIFATGMTGSLSSPAGKVGIGTTSPTDKLDVSGAIGLVGTTSTIPSNGFYLPSANNLTLASNGAAAVTITATQSVGIGTTSPSVSLDLHAKTDALGLPDGTTAARPTGAAGMIRYNSDSDVFEGYYASTATWTSIVSATSTAVASSGVLGTSTATANPHVTGDVTTGLFSGLAHTVSVTASGIEELRVTATSVGIGTTSPNSALEVNGAATFGVGSSSTPSINFSGALTTGLYYASSNVYVVSSGTQIAAFSGGITQFTGVAQAGAYDNTAYVSSGSTYTPSVNSGLRAANTYQATGADAMTNFEVYNGSATPNAQWAYMGAVANSGASTYSPDFVIGRQTGAATYGESVRITASGNVGIGTTSPSGILDVEGGTAAASTAGIGVLLVGQSGSGTNKAGGGLTFTAGNSTGTSGVAGAITMTAGVGGTGAAGGTITINGGLGGSSAGAGGGVNIVGGTGTAGNSAGGTLNLFAGTSTGSGASGSVLIQSGTPGATGTSGTITLQTATPIANNGGAITIATATGVGTNKSGGNILMMPGAGTGTGSSGYVGIGTTSPTDKLDVSGAIGLVGTTSTVPSNGFYLPSANNLTLASNGAAAVTITATQSVGIGTTSPSVSLDLHVKTDALYLQSGTTGQRPTGAAGMIRYNSTLDQLEGYFTGTATWGSLLTTTSTALASAVNLGTATGATNPHVTGDVTTGLFSAVASTVSVATSGVEALRITATQSVGIGTASPSVPLHVAGAIYGLNGESHFSFGSWLDPHGGTAAAMKISSSSSSYDALDTTGGNVLFMNGSVGIGTTSPSGILDVEGGTAAASTAGIGVLLVGQSGSGTNKAGGGITVTAGNSTGTGTAGAILMNAGVGGTGAAGGTVTVNGGQGGSTSGAGGALALNGGSGGAAAGAGGVATMQGGAGVASNGAGGTAYLLGGTSTGSGASGSVLIQSGTPGATGTSGTITLQTATPIANNGGAITIATATGVGTNKNGGNIYLLAGAATGSGTNGRVGVNTTSPNVSLDLGSNTDALYLPSGTTAQRPTGLAGMVRYNSTNDALEGYFSGSATWGALVTTTSTALTANSSNLGTSTATTSPHVSTDLTTGLFSAAASTVSVATAGVEALRITATQSVGIGTTTPAQKLDVSGKIKTSTGLITPLIHPATDSTSAVQIDKADGTTNVMTVDTTNVSVGVGVNNPYSVYNSNFVVLGDGGLTIVPSDYAGASQNAYLTIKKLGGNYGQPATIQAGDGHTSDSIGLNPAGGNVGVGTSAPASRFDVVGNISIGSYAGVNAAPTNGAIISGNVGIGTNSPSGILDVEGGTAAAATSGSGILLVGQSGSGTNKAGGGITVTAGNSTGTGAAGAILMNAGVGGTGAAGGTVTVNGGQGGSTSGAGGALALNGGSGGAAAGAGGVATMQGGAGVASNGAGGTAYLLGGTSTGSGASGSVLIQSGTPGATGTSGTITLQTATPIANNGGNITIATATGVGSNKNGGNIYLLVGAATGSGTNGRIGVNTTSPNVSLDLGSNTDALYLPSGSTSARPTGLAGMIRYNSTLDQLEGYFTGTATWGSLLTTTSTALASAVNLGTGTATANPHVTGDVTTGLFSGLAHTVSVTASGIEELRVTATSVGIGTTSPTDKLDVSGAIGLVGTTSTVPSNGFYLPSANNLTLASNGAAAVTITATQSVGIGTATPTNTLHVFGVTRLDNNSGDNTNRAYGLTVGFSPASNYVNGADPTDGLRNTALIADVANRPVILTMRNVAGGGFWDIVMDANDSSKLKFSKSGSAVNMTLDGTNVGIGTTSPSGILDVEGGTAAASTAGIGVLLVGQSGSGTNKAGGGLTFTAGNSTGTGTAGAILMNAGVGGTGAAGGTVTVNGGQGGSTSGAGGALALNGGSGGAAAGAGGVATMQGGAGVASNGAGGTAYLLGGTSTGSGASGSVLIQSGTPGATGTSGTITLQTATPIANNGGNITIATATGVGSNKNGGNIYLLAGAATGSGTNGRIGVNTTSPNATLDLGSVTDAIVLPVGTTGNRPTGVNGMIRYSSSPTAQVEAYVNNTWSALGGGATITLGTGTATANPHVTGDVTTGLFSGLAHTVSVTASGIEELRVTATSVGIGTTSPTDKLDVSGAIGLVGTTSTVPSNGFYLPSANNLTLASNGAAAVTITATQSVGIGTTAPGYPLDILTSGGATLRIDAGSGYNSELMLADGGTTRWNIYNQGSTLYVLNNGTVAGVSMASGNSSWSAFSDRRLKTDIQTFSILDRLNDYRAVSYRWKSTGKQDLGVIAQELYNTFPELVDKGSDTGEVDKVTDAGVWGVRYDRLGALAMQGVKELKTLFDTDHDALAKLKTDNDNAFKDLKKENDDLRAQLAVLQMKIETKNVSSGAANVEAHDVNRVVIVLGSGFGVALVGLGLVVWRMRRDLQRLQKATTTSLSDKSPEHPSDKP